MKCPFCITSDQTESFPFDEAVALLRRLRSQSVKYVVLGGGEPTLWRGDLFRLAKEAKGLGFIVQLGTNSIALSPGFEYADEIDRYVIPLEAMDEKIHNRLRPYRESHYAIVRDRLQKLKHARKSLTVSTLITRENIVSITALAHFLRTYSEQSRLHAWHLYKLIPFGRGGAMHANELDIPDSDYWRVCRQIQAMKLPFKVYCRGDMYHSKNVEFFWYEKGAVHRGADQWGDVSWD